MKSVAHIQGPSGTGSVLKILLKDDNLKPAFTKVPSGFIFGFEGFCVSLFVWGSFGWLVFVVGFVCLFWGGFLVNETYLKPKTLS